MNIYLEAAKLQDQGNTFAMATIISSQGSTPRNTAKMIVRGDGSILGTIGGGPVEAYVIEEAVRAIRLNQSKVVDYTLNSDAPTGIEMLCGGTLTVLIEVIRPRPRIIMIGAGHIGLAVAKLAEILDYQLAVVDDRPEFASTERYPMAVEIYADPDIARAIEKVTIDANSYIVIATKDMDYRALKKVITTDAAYIGMIGSKRKVGLVVEKLLNDGIPKTRLLSLYSPVGLDIGAETPEEIAVSIMAEILKVRNGKTGLSLREVNKNH